MATVNKDIRTLKRVFNLAIEPRGYLLPHQNPFARIKQRRLTAKTIRYVPHEEFCRVAAVESPAWLNALVRVAYTTAARLGELQNLTWADVDFEQGLVRILRKDAVGHMAAWEPKDHEGRLLPIPEQVIQQLVDLQAEAVPGCPYVFVPRWRWDYITRQKDTGRWDDGLRLIYNLIPRLNALCTKAGVKRFTYHDLRRTCVTN